MQINRISMNFNVIVIFILNILWKYTLKWSADIVTAEEQSCFRGLKQNKGHSSWIEGEYPPSAVPMMLANVAAVYIRHRL